MMLFPSQGRIVVALAWGALSFATEEEAAGLRSARATRNGVRWRPRPPVLLLPPAESHWGRLGFGPARFRSSFKAPVTTAAEWRVPQPTLVREREAFVILPLWSLCAGGLLLPISRAAIHVRRRRAARAARRGVCTRCGYDLRATPNRCPECGAPAAAGVEG